MIYNDLDSLRQACLSCRRCGLCEGRHNVVFGIGPEKAEVMFIGEGPGEQEDLQGEPFVGAAGQFLDEMLSIIGLSRRNCYIGNIVKCRPPKNRDPHNTEQENCRPWLDAQIRIIKPKLIVCLGRIAACSILTRIFVSPGNTVSGNTLTAHGVWQCIIPLPCSGI